MIRHNRLFNPIAQTRVMDTSEFIRYIRLRELCEWFPVGEESTRKRVDEIREDFYSAHSDVAGSRLDEVWAYVGSMVEKNPALARFIIDHNATKSGYFFPWLMTIVQSPSAALELAYGNGFDAYGNWVNGIPEEDEIDDFVKNVPTLVYQRERQFLMADLVSSVKENGQRDRSAFEHRLPVVVDLGAGRMAWARYHGFRFDSAYLKVIAVDKDPGIDPEKLFEPFAPKGRYVESDTLSYLGLEFQKADILPWLATTDLRDVDLIMLGGVASYFPLPAFTEAVIKPAYKILREGGSFFFDLQLECPQYEWTIKMFGWPEMKLMKTAAEAITQVEAIRMQLWEAGLKFNAEYHLDTACANPSAVMIIFQKL